MGFTLFHSLLLKMAIEIVELHLKMVDLSIAISNYHRVMDMFTINPSVSLAVKHLEPSMGHHISGDEMNHFPSLIAGQVQLSNFLWQTQ